MPDERFQFIIRQAQQTFIYSLMMNAVNPIADLEPEIFRWIIPERFLE